MDYALVGLGVAVLSLAGGAFRSFSRVNERLSTMETALIGTDKVVEQHSASINTLREVQSDTREELAKMSSTLNHVVMQFAEARAAFQGMSTKVDGMASSVAGISSRLEQALSSRRRASD